jgi:hypothetical protein
MIMSYKHKSQFLEKILLFKISMMCLVMLFEELIKRRVSISLITTSTYFCKKWGLKKTSLKLYLSKMLKNRKLLYMERPQKNIELKDRTPKFKHEEHLLRRLQSQKRFILDQR